MTIRHVYPLNDLQEHDTESAGQCDCDPRVGFINGDTLVIHNSYDGREIIERLENPGPQEGRGAAKPGERSEPEKESPRLGLEGEKG